MRKRELKVGVRVRVKDNAKAIMEKVGNWDGDMKSFVGKEGVVCNLHTGVARADCSVKFSSGNSWAFKTECLELVKAGVKVKVPAPKKVTKPVPKPTPKEAGPRYHVGQVFEGGGGLHLLSQVNPSMVAMIGLGSGNRWSDPVKVLNSMEITEKEVSNLGSFKLAFNSIRDYMDGKRVPVVVARKVVYSTTVERVSNDAYTSRERFEQMNPGFKFIRFEGDK